jgi:signal transduction histidine kinase
MLIFFDLLTDDFDSFTLAEIHEHLKNLQLVIKNVYSLLEHLLQWASVQTGRVKYQPQKMNLRLIVDETFLFTMIMAQQKNIELLNLVPVDMDIYADSNMIETVIRNLVNNSIKFTPLGGQVRVEAVANDDMVQVSVADNGVGIEAYKLPNLFRLDNRYTTLGTANEKGTGLGLVLCKEFVEKHSGKIGVKSQLGQGTTFFFTVPMPIVA